MIRRRGSTSGVLLAVLVVAVVALASSTLYLAFVNPRLVTGGTGGNGVISVPAYSGLGAASGQIAGMNPPADSITVIGTGSVTYVPNEALVSLSVVTTNKTAQAATQTNAETTLKVIKALNGIGVSNDSIQTQGFTLYPNYNNYNYPATPQIMSYTVTNSILVNLTSTDPVQLGLRAGRTIDTGVGAGSNQVYLQFAATKALQDQVNTKALQQAVASAASTAKTIADSLGVKISGVISVTQGYSYYPSYTSSGAVFAALPAAAPAVSTPLLPGTQTGTASVTVVYSIA